MVQAYRVLCDWTTQLPINVDAAATTGAQAIQLINLAIGSEPLIDVSRDPAIFIWNFSFFIFRIEHQAGKEMVDADHILRQTNLRDATPSERLEHTLIKFSGLCQPGCFWAMLGNV